MPLRKPFGNGTSNLILSARNPSRRERISPSISQYPRIEPGDSGAKSLRDLLRTSTFRKWVFASSGDSPRHFNFFPRLHCQNGLRIAKRNSHGIHDFNLSLLERQQHSSEVHLSRTRRFSAAWVDRTHPRHK